MSTEPAIKALSIQKRQNFFLVLLTVFLVALPAFIFYTTGYRLSFDNKETTVVTTGGIYVTADDLNIEVYLDEEKVDKPRLFRSAYYIQNIENGLHRVVVQSPGLQTWVKILPVDSYIVTEAAAFNMPEIPHIRAIAEYVNPVGKSVYFGKSTTTNLFPKATTTDSYVIATKAGDETLEANEEFDYVVGLFATSTASSTKAAQKIREQVAKLRFATSTASSGLKLPPFLEQNNLRLVEEGNELLAYWTGPSASTPHYFCTPQSASTTVALRLGLHFAQQIESQALSTTTPLHIEGDRVCRATIRLDRKWQKVKYHKFFPRSTDLVIMQLEDGLHVTEIDDRSWQNTQMIYPGDNFKTVVTDTNIYIKEDGRYFELLTTIPTNN